MQNISPLLAVNANMALVRFPVLASPKIDGVRALVRDGVVYSRSGKPIPNDHVQALFGRHHGFDGELIVGDATSPDVFRKTQSGVMASWGKPDVRFLLFDSWNRGAAPFAEWYEDQKAATLGERVTLVEQTALDSLDALDAYESARLADGYEGVMLRNPAAGYKNGRSTAREGILLKVKRFSDAEAVIDGLEEQRDAAGNPNGVLGAFLVRDMQSGAAFALGTGFTASERARFWRLGNALRGSCVRYRFFASGSTDKPRFPVFAGARDRLDMAA